MKQAPTFFDTARLRMDEALELTAQSLRAYGASYRHWVIAYSGGSVQSVFFPGEVFA